MDTNICGTIVQNSEEQKRKEMQIIFNKYIYLECATNSKCQLQSTAPNDYAVFVLSETQTTSESCHEPETKTLTAWPKPSTSVSSEKTSISKSLFSFVNTRKKSRASTMNLKSNTEVLLTLKTQSKIPVLKLKRNSSVCGLQSMRAIQQPEESQASISTCNEEVLMCKTDFGQFKSKCSLDECAASTSTCLTTMPVCYLNCTNIMNMSVTDGIREVLNLIDGLYGSEKFISQIISKYILDHELKVELLDVVSNHAHLQSEAERRAQSLSQDILNKQIEFSKSREMSLQESLENVIKENRTLRDENDTLQQRVELLSSRQSTVHRGSYVMEGLNRSNDNLRNKISNLQKQLDTLDSSLISLTERNRVLEDQIIDYTKQTSLQKELLHRSETEHRMEVSTLHKEIRANVDYMRKIRECGDSLLQDMHNLKRQSIIDPAKWPNLSKCDNINELISASHQLIAELAKENAQKQNELQVKSLDWDSFKNENISLATEKNNALCEVENLRKELKAIKLQLLENNIQLNNTMILEDHVKMFQTELERKSNEFDELSNNYDNLLKETINKNTEVVTLRESDGDKAKANEQLTKEITFLKLQLEEINSLLFSTGTADIAKELARSNEKLIDLQEKHTLSQLENQTLIERLNQQEMDRMAIALYQDNCNKYFEGLQSELQKVSSGNELLRKQLEGSKNYIMSLEMERRRHLDEKEMLKNMYDKHSSEMSRLQALEGTVSNMSKEKWRLSKVAEFNKLLGEKLKCEVVERDHKIQELKSNLDKMNEIQIESTKEKVSLCEELTEICTYKEMLDNQLAAEQQRNMLLAENKSKIESTANVRVQELEEKLNEKQKEIQTRIENIKSLSLDNEHFKLQLQLQTDKLHEAHSQLRELKEQLKKTETGLYEKKEANSELKLKINCLESQLSDVTTKYEFNLNNHQTIVNELQKKISSGAQEMESMDTSLQFMQNTVHKLQRDLDDSRAKEKDNHSLIETGHHKIEILQMQLDQKVKIIDDSEKGRNKELNRIDSLTNSYNTLSQEYEKHVKETAESDKNNSIRLELSKKDIENLTERLEEAKHEIRNYKENYRQLENSHRLMKDVTTDIETQSQILSESNDHIRKLNESLHKEQMERKKLEIKVFERKKRISGLKQNIAHISEQGIKEKEQLEKIICDIKNEYITHKEAMYTDLVTMQSRLKKMTADYLDHKGSHQKYEEAHKSLAEKLLRSVKMLVEEKIFRQSAESRFMELQEKINKIEQDKVLAEEKLKIYKEQTDDLRKDLKDVTSKCKKMETRPGSPDSNVKDKQTECSELKKLIDQLQQTTNQSSNKTLDIQCDMALQNDTSKQKLDALKTALEKSHKKCMKLQEELGKLQEQYTVLEFKNSELALKLHESQVKCTTTESVVKNLREIHSKVVNHAIELKRDGALDERALDSLVTLLNSKCLVS